LINTAATAVPLTAHPEFGDSIWLVIAFALSQITFQLVNIWNSQPNHAVDVNTVNLFKARLDRFWANQEVKCDFTADLTRIGYIVLYEIMW